MARILITSGPTRQYLDPVRYLSNASSGKMGAALAAAAIQMGHEIVIVSGPVSVEYPAGAEVVNVVSTGDMLTAARKHFQGCDGVIAAAAPCDYQPVEIAAQKIKKTGGEISIQLRQTEDVLAALGQMKTVNQWSVGFALETEDPQAAALKKLKQKNCDLIVLNGVAAIESDTNSVQIIDRRGTVIEHVDGSKAEVAVKIFHTIKSALMNY
jgi:phosphopantothenoylcysteine decarboxylase/phosphopantothenate--cysteine ligase